MAILLEKVSGFNIPILEEIFSYSFPWTETVIHLWNKELSMQTITVSASTAHIKLSILQNYQIESFWSFIVLKFLIRNPIEVLVALLYTLSIFSKSTCKWGFHTCKNGILHVLDRRKYSFNAPDLLFNFLFSIPSNYPVYYTYHSILNPY